MLMEDTTADAAPAAAQGDRKERGKPLLKGIMRMDYMAAAAAYLIIALAVLAPIIAQMSTLAPGIGGDSYQNLWDLWWVVHAVSSMHSIWFTSYLFHPVGANLLYQTMSPISAIITAPFQAISIPFAYNVMLVLGFVISGLCMYALAKYVTRNAYASFLAGLFFSFSAFHLAQAYAHIDWLTIGWIPLSLYFFLKTLNEENKFINAAGLGVCFVLASFMGDIEQGIMVVLVLLAVLAAYMIKGSSRKLVLNRRFVESMLLALAVAFVLGSWGFIPIAHAILSGGAAQQTGYLNQLQNNALWSDTLASFFVPSYYNGIFDSKPSAYFNGVFEYATQQGVIPDQSERVAYVGYTVMLLALYGILKNRKEYKLWLGLLIIFGWLSLGPYLQLGGTSFTNPTPVPGLYLIYHFVPIVNVIREPDRLYLVFSMCAAVLAALGARSLMERCSNWKLKRSALVVTGIIAMLFVIEAPGLPLSSALVSLTATNAQVPQLYQSLGGQQGNFSLLMLPAAADPYSAYAEVYPAINMYYAAIANKSIIGGYVLRTNASQNASMYNLPLVVQALDLEVIGNLGYDSIINQDPTNATLLLLSPYNYGIPIVAVDKLAYNQSSLSQLILYMLGVFGAPVYNDNTTMAFQTSNAISRSIFRSYVSYSVGWQERAISLKGNYSWAWQPANPGVIIAFAPYSNSSAPLPMNSTERLVNTTISFYAISNSTLSSALYINETSAGRSGNIAEFNVTSAMRRYSVNVPLVSGPRGNAFFFSVAQNFEGSTVFVRNVTFSRAG
jgi:hypothetical protein